MPEDLFYIVDGHISAEGHRIAAAAIARRFAAATDGAFADCRGGPSGPIQAAPIQAAAAQAAR